MDVCLSHLTAFRLLMQSSNERPGRRTLASHTRVPLSAPPNSFVSALKSELNATGPLDVLVSSANGKRNDQVTVSHVASRPLPAASFRRAEFPSGAIACVCSPELVFLQLASTYTVDEAIYFGFALCSSYRIDAASKGGVAHREGADKPLTSTKQLAAFLDAVPGMRGCVKARRALAFVKDGARSPMESALAMGYGLPTRLGGFNVGKVALNQAVRVTSGTTSEGTRYATRIPDLTITARGKDGIERNVLLDYDADAVHATRTGLARNARRRNQLATIDSAAYISMSTDQALEYRSYADVAEQIRIALKRPRTPKVSLASSNPAAVERYEQANARRIEFWKKHVCFSDFRKLERF